MSLAPHQQRVVDEKTDLDTKREKLAAFFGTEIFASLRPDEQGRMRRQILAMDDYAGILGERIGAFAKAA